MSSPHINTHGRRLAVGFHWVPLQRVMRDEIRGSPPHMAQRRARIRIDNRCRHLPLQHAQLVRLMFASAFTSLTAAWCGEKDSVGVAETSLSVETGIGSSSLNHTHKSWQQCNKFNKVIHYLSSPPNFGFTIWFYVRHRFSFSTAPSWCESSFINGAASQEEKKWNFTNKI